MSRRRATPPVVSTDKVVIDGPPVASNAVILPGPASLTFDQVVTDADILEFGRSFRDGTATDAIWRARVQIALGLTLDEARSVHSCLDLVVQEILRRRLL